jgi:hypothetical protein
MRSNSKMDRIVILVVAAIICFAVCLLSGLLSLVFLYGPVTIADGYPSAVALQAGDSEVSYRLCWVSACFGIVGFGLIVFVFLKRKSNAA